MEREREREREKERERDTHACMHVQYLIQVFGKQWMVFAHEMSEHQGVMVLDTCFMAVSSNPAARVSQGALLVRSVAILCSCCAALAIGIIMIMCCLRSETCACQDCFLTAIGSLDSSGQTEAWRNSMVTQETARALMYGCAWLLRGLLLCMCCQHDMTLWLFECIILLARNMGAT